MTKVLRLALLGRLQLSLGGSQLADLTSGKAQALLCYLAVTGRPHSRQALAGLLWGSLPEADARRNLRGVVLRLRQAAEGHLLITYRTLAIDRESDYWLDVEQFQAKLARRAGRMPTPDALQEAVDLYRGDFLEELHVRNAPDFEKWVMGQRHRFREQALDACQALCIHYADQGAHELGMLYARRLLDLDPVREEGWQQLLLLLAKSGQRNVALSQYEICREVLMSELGVEPSPETMALAERIRAGDLGEDAKRQRVGQGVRVPRPIPVTRPEPRPAEPPPFMAGPPITHPRQFYGRERELRRLFNLLKRLPLQNAAIIGPRRSGKTSLLHYLRKITTTSPAELRPAQRSDWLPQPARYRWVFVDFQDPRMGEREALLRYLLNQMGLPVPETCDLESFLDVVSEGLQRPAVVLLDEIGVALQRYPQLDDAFWESLRSLATNQVGGNLGFVLASSRLPVDLAQHSGLGSPFFNIFGYTAELGPLSEAAARALIAAAPLPFPEEDVEWILAESGRWPVLLQILCQERLMALEDEEPGDAWRVEAVRQMGPFRRVAATDEE